MLAVMPVKSGLRSYGGLQILYRSTEPIAVRIDTDDLNSITIPDLPSCSVSKFSTKVEVMDYLYGVLTIEGKDKNNSPFVVSLI